MNGPLVSVVVGVAVDVDGVVPAAAVDVPALVSGVAVGIGFGCAFALGTKSPDWSVDASATAGSVSLSAVVASVVRSDDAG